MRYENTSDAERRHHHPGGHGHGPGFGGFGRGGGHRRGRGRGFGRPGGWQQADLPPTDDLTALAHRTPSRGLVHRRAPGDRRPGGNHRNWRAAGTRGGAEGGDGASAEGRISRFRRKPGRSECRSRTKLRRATGARWRGERQLATPRCCSHTVRAGDDAASAERAARARHAG